MTETRQRSDRTRRTEEGPNGHRMRDVQHVHPLTGESFQNAYDRGPAVADGGETEADETPDQVSHPSPESPAEGEGEVDAEPSAPDGDDEMRDVDHTPPEEEAGANRVWERGGEPDPEAETEERREDR